MLYQDTASFILDGMMQVRHCYLKMLDALSHDSGLPRIELEILLFLHNHPNHNTATDIAETKNFTKSHISAALKHLESKGYIHRWHEPGNQKTVHISIEPAAQALVQDGLAIQACFIQKLLDGISPVEMEAVRSVQQKIVGNAKDITDQLSKAA